MLPVVTPLSQPYAIVLTHTGVTTQAGSTVTTQADFATIVEDDVAVRMLHNVAATMRTDDFAASMQAFTGATKQANVTKISQAKVVASSQASFENVKATDFSFLMDSAISNTTSSKASKIFDVKNDAATFDICRSKCYECYQSHGYNPGAVVEPGPVSNVTTQAVPRGELMRLNINIKFVFLNWNDL